MSSLTRTLKSMNKTEIESIINDGDAYKVVEQGGWVINLDTHTYENHIVQCSDDLRFYRLECYIRKAPNWLHDSSDAYLVEVVPVEKTVVHWREVG